MTDFTEDIANFEAIAKNMRGWADRLEALARAQGAWDAEMQALAAEQRARADWAAGVAAKLRRGDTDGIL